MKYISTRNSSKTFEFKDVFIKGLADDGGLFIPKSLIKFSKSDIDEFKDLNYQELAKKIDQSLQNQNIYYFDLIMGKVLQPLKITKVKTGGFQEYMKSIGKLGGQNKIPRLANDRTFADLLQSFKL